jgi:hypothetical protein
MSSCGNRGEDLKSYTQVGLMVKTSYLAEGRPTGRARERMPPSIWCGVCARHLVGLADVKTFLILGDSL